MTFRLENNREAPIRITPTLAVAAAGRLGNRVEPCLRSQHNRKVQIDTGFDQGRGDDTTGIAVVEIVADSGKNLPSMCRAHQCREMACAGQMADCAIKFARVLTMHSA